MGDRLAEREEDVLYADLERVIDEYQERPKNDRPKHPSIVFDITLENQALTQNELNYIHRLYRIPTDVSVSLIGLGEDPARPLPEVVACIQEIFQVWT